MALDNALVLISSGEFGDDYIFHHMSFDYKDTHSIVIMHRAGIAFAQMDWDDDDTITLRYLSVDESHRKNGLGLQLQIIREKLGVTMGAKYTELLVIEDSWMHNWYKKRGYVDIENHADESSWIWMRKEL